MIPSPDSKGARLKKRLARRWYTIAFILLAAMIMSGCVGGLASSSWPGLVISDGLAYITSVQGVYAVNIDPNINNALRQEWVFPTGAEGEDVGGMTFHATPVLTPDNVLYFASDSAGRPAGRVFAFNTEVRAELWRYPPKEESPLSNIFGGLAYDGDSVYASTSNGFVISLDARLGTLNWAFDTEQQLWSTPVVSDSTVYVTAQDHNLYALNARDGSVKWTFAAGALLVGTPTLYQGTIYAGSFDQNLYAIDASSGTLEWTFKAQGWLWDGPEVFDDTLYFGDLSGNLYAVDLNGRQLWTTELQGAIRAQPLVTEDRIYVGTQQRLLYALDRTTRNPVWPAPFMIEQEGAELLTTPVLIDDRLFITPIPAGNPPVRLYAIQAASGNVVMRFPDPSAPPQ